MQQKLVARWGNAIASVLSQISGAEWKADDESAFGSEVPFQSPVKMQFALSKALAGRLHLSLETVDALRLVAIFTGADQAPAWDAEQQEAIDELFRQFAGAFATSIKADVGEVDARLEAVSAFNPAASPRMLLFKGPQEQSFSLALEIDEILARATMPPTVHSGGEASKSPPPANNLDLLMHVELAVTLRFGQRQMLLQEILDLQSGSVIELDREIQEPVDLLLDGRIIARGNVVIVDGNYGLRVSEVGAVLAEV